MNGLPENMNVEELTLAKEQAEKEYNDLKKLFKDSADLHRRELYKDLKKVYGHMTHGRKLIDVESSIRRAGVNLKGQPKLAICRADAVTCYLSLNSNGSAVFTWKDFSWNVESPRKTYGEFGMPPGSFGDLWKNLGWRERKLKAPVPLIPPHIMIEEIKHRLNNYYILWEVEEWNRDPPRDPILLKRVTRHLYAVLATWDLTEVERAVIRGHITS